MFFAVVPLALLLLVLPAGLIRHVYFDRSSLPDIEPFIRFEPPTTGKVFDARKVLWWRCATRTQPSWQRQAGVASPTDRLMQASATDRVGARATQIRHAAVETAATWSKSPLPGKLFFGLQ